MGYTIAIAGKGGTGKTTLAALLVRALKENKKGSILAVDADPNSNLAEALGVTSDATIGGILDDICADPQKIPAGISKDRFIEFQVQTAIAEGPGFDVLTMGRPEGPGCYCYVNNVLRNLVAKLIKEYDFVVIDNEAGLEHLSRRTTRAADAFVMVSDATAVGLRAAERINRLIEELGIKAKKVVLVLNRFTGDIEKEKIMLVKSNYIGNIPVDDEIMALSLQGKSIMDLSAQAVSMRALEKILDKIL